jgi:nucleotide-binding universal stress UspA family protein
MFTNPIVRVLAVVDLAFPPFTSLTPFARRAYQQATAYWRGQQELSIQRVIDQIVPALPEAVDFVWLRPVRGHMRQAVTRYVLEWPADVVVIAPPASGVRSWLWFGQACNRLLLHSTCAVIVTAGGVDKARQ